MKHSILTTMLLATLALAGCNQQQNNGVGPAEQAGKAIDDAGAKVAAKVQDQVQKADVAVQQTRDQVKEATADASRNVDRVTEVVGKKVERAGEKIQEAAH